MVAGEGAETANESKAPHDVMDGSLEKTCG